MRFTSHRDVARVFERTLRKIGVPMAYSQGFSPHPKISWLGAAPTGAASEAEYVEIQVIKLISPRQLRDALTNALPTGLVVTAVIEAGDDALAKQVNASQWLIELPGVSAVRLREAVDLLLAQHAVEIERITRDGRRTINVRSALVSAKVSSSAEVVLSTQCGESNTDAACFSAQYGILDVVVRHVTPTVRPDDIVSALRVVADLVAPQPAKATRTRQGLLDDSGCLVDPFGD